MKSQLDDLRRGIDQTIDAATQGAYNAKKAYDQSTVGRFQHDLTLWARFWSHIVRIAVWVWQRIVRPLAKPVWRVVRWFVVNYRDLWLALVYSKDKYDDEKFSIWRGISVAIGTWVIASVLLLHLWVAGVATFWYFPLVQHDETLYLYNSQKISEGLDPASTWDDVHEVHGCETLPCTDQTSVTFRVRASWFNELWSIYHHGSLFYPGYVAGAVAPVMERCVITS